MQRGKLVIMVIVSVAFLMAGFACWYRYQQGRKALRLWGVESAQLIRHAPQVELLTLGEPMEAATNSTLRVDGTEFEIRKREDISHTRGLVHARHVFIEDASFAWKAKTNDCQGDWTYVLRFSEGEKTATVALDLKCGRSLLLETGADVRLVERISKALAKYIGDHFEPPKLSVEAPSVSVKA